MTDNNKPHFVTSKNFRGDKDYVEWLREIKSRYHTVHYHMVIKNNTKSQETENQNPKNCTSLVQKSILLVVSHPFSMMVIILLIDWA